MLRASLDSLAGGPSVRHSGRFTMAPGLVVPAAQALEGGAANRVTFIESARAFIEYWSGIHIFY